MATITVKLLPTDLSMEFQTKLQFKKTADMIAGMWLVCKQYDVVASYESVL